MSDASNELRLRQKVRRQAGLRNIDYPLCQPGTFGAEFYRLTPEPTDIIVTKNRYSAFINTNLDLILRSLGRKSLVFCGGGTNMCLESSVRHAFMLDYYCVVVADCSPTPWGEEAYRATLENIELGFGQVIDLAEAFDVWDRQRDQRRRGAA